MSKDFYADVRDRRSYYGISRQSPIPDGRIVEIVQFAVKHAPSAFNGQSGRAVVLLGQEHDALWGIVLDELKKKVHSEKFAKTREKIALCKVVE